MEWNTEDREKAATYHVHALLADYSRAHYTLNYQEATTEWIAEFLEELTPAPLFNPTDPILPVEPLTVFFGRHSIDAIKPHDETPPTSNDAIKLVKDSMFAMRGGCKGRVLRSEKSLNVDSYPVLEPSCLPEDYMLSRTAREHTRSIGSPSRGSKLKFDSLDLPPPLPDSQVSEPRLPLDDLLNVNWSRAQGTLPALRELLLPVAQLAKPLPKEMFNEASYIRRFTDGPLNDASLDIVELRFMPMFARSKRPGFRVIRTASAQQDFERQEALGLGGWSDVPDMVEDPAAYSASSDDIPKQSMKLLDGWETIYSSPSPPPSQTIVEEEVDELSEDKFSFFLRHGSTPPTDDVPLAEEVENCKLEVPIFPRARKVGGNAGVQPHILRDHTMESFIQAHVPGSKSTPRKGSDQPNKDMANSGLPSSPGAPGTSILGLPPTSIIDSEVAPKRSTKTLELDVNVGVDEDVERLYMDMRLDPLSVILDEGIEDGKSAGSDFMQVPTLPEPMEHDQPAWIPKSLGDLTKCEAANAGAKALGVGGVKKEILKKAAMKQSLSLCLSWAAFRVTEQLPTLDSALDIETPLCRREPELHASIMQSVEKVWTSSGVSPASSSSSSDLGVIGEQSRPEPYLAILDNTLDLAGNGCNLPEESDLLMLGRLERKRLERGKRRRDGMKMSSDDQIDDAGATDGIEAEQERYEEIDRDSASKRQRTDVEARDEQNDRAFASSSGNRRFIEGVESSETFEPALAPPCGHDPYGEEDKENWDPSSSSSPRSAKPIFQPPPLEYDELLEDWEGQTELMDVYDSRMNVEDGEHLGEGYYNGRPHLDMSMSVDVLEMYEVDEVVDMLSPHGMEEVGGDGPGDFGMPMTDTQTRPERYGDATCDDTAARWYAGDDKVASAWAKEPLCLDKMAEKVHNDTSHFGRLASMLGTFSHAQSLSNFACTRSVQLPPRSQQMQETTLVAPLEASPIPAVDKVPQEKLVEESLNKTVPPELIDSNTIILPSDRYNQRTMHKYLASLDTIQKRALVNALRSPANRVALVERSTMASFPSGPGASTVATHPHIILDPWTCLLLVPLLTLPATGDAYGSLISSLSWTYRCISVVFEAYPESCSLRSNEKKSELCAYTPPVMKAVRKMKRDIGIARGVGSMSGEDQSMVRWGFANCVGDAAALVRLCGDLAENRDRNPDIDDGQRSGGVIWDGGRAWLGEEDGNTWAEDEADILAVKGLNPFTAALVLSQVGLEEFLAMSAGERMELFGRLIGTSAVASINEDISARYQSLSDASSSAEDGLYFGSPGEEGSLMYCQDGLR